MDLQWSIVDKFTHDVAENEEIMKQVFALVWKSISVLCIDDGNFLFPIFS